MGAAELRFDPSQCPVLSRHADLKTRAEGDVLVLPERALRLGGSGGEILRLCDGLRRGHAIVAAMRDRYPESPVIETEIIDFLEEMFALGGIVAQGDVAGTTR